MSEATVDIGGDAQPQAHAGTPDVTYWASLAGWKMAEAAALLLSLDPDRLVDELGSVGSGEVEFKRLHRRLRRARDMGALRTLEAPREVLNWAKTHKIVVPQELWSAVQAAKHPRSWRKRYFAVKKELAQALAELEDVQSSQEQASEIVMSSDRPLRSDEKRTFQKIILGMARDKFSFKTIATSPHTVTKICNALGDGPLFVSDETVRKKLRDAAEALLEDESG